MERGSPHRGANIVSPPKSLTVFGTGSLLKTMVRINTIDTGFRLAQLLPLSAPVRPATDGAHRALGNLPKSFPVALYFVSNPIRFARFPCVTLGQSQSP